jgi:hypothetical protein
LDGGPVPRMVRDTGQVVQGIVGIGRRVGGTGEAAESRERLTGRKSYRARPLTRAGAVAGG